MHRPYNAPESREASVDEVPRLSKTAPPLQPNRASDSTAESEPSAPPASEMLELDRSECLRLLATTAVGRIAVSVAGWDHPVVRPVNYRFDAPSQSVVFRTASGSKLHAVLRSATAAFEIDGLDPASRLGWSVIILGVSEEITDASELRRVEGLGLEPWAPGRKPHWVRIRAHTVSGRRISALTGSDDG